MALPLQQLAMEAGSADLVRATLIENGAAPALVQALIPSRSLEAGEQYRFHFDMTKCIGCRSCEIACNEQNGNPAPIQWRRVGELEGGVYPHTQRTYLSMGCNHCLSADCLRGCPVNAYTKDPVTGIVLHSADACIGCQYCVWNCPYSVPQFNPERGVVGKCDMCRDRLLDGREPACVNACPENAIQIEIVNKEEWRRDYQAAESPGMPPAGQTISTTRITLPETSSSWLERVDTGTIRTEHAHPSLIIMTTAMQAAFGTLAVFTAAHVRSAPAITLLWLLTSVALNVSVFHLGRPAYAWRAIRMWRRSWLSREVLLFGLFYAAVSACALASWVPALHTAVAPLEIIATVFGLCGTLASAAIYLVKARPAWNMIHTPLDFLLSAVLLGSVFAGIVPALAGMGLFTRPSNVLSVRHPETADLSTALRSGRDDKVVAGLTSDHLTNLSSRPERSEVERSAVSLVLTQSLQARLVALCVVLWLCNQLVRVVRLHRSANFERRASYNLIRGEQLVYPAMLACLSAAATIVFAWAPLPWLALLTATVTVAIGRYLFFVSVVPLSMGLTFLSKREGHAWA